MKYSDIRAGLRIPPKNTRREGREVMDLTIMQFGDGEDIRHNVFVKSRVTATRYL